MTDEELGRALWEDWRGPAHGTSAWTKLAHRARELIAAEAKPVATGEDVEKFIADYAGHWSRDDCASSSKIRDLILAALSYFSPPTPEGAPILGMTVEKIEAEFLTQTRGLDLQTLQICAVVAHRLAQPVPNVDPDAEAKRLAWARYCALTIVGARYQNYEAYFQSLTPDDQDGWRAVAAAKGVQK